MFRRFGSRVTIVEERSEVLPREDDDVAAELRKALEAEGIGFELDVRTTHVANKNERIVLTLEGTGKARTVAGTHLLVATGRRPSTDDLGLEHAGVLTDERGFIKVNGHLETSVPGIWALGDVKGGPAFTHVSSNDYQVIWANLVEEKTVTTDDRIVPYSIFTDPQLGSVGLTEKKARQKGYRLLPRCYPSHPEPSRSTKTACCHDRFNP
jgi:pyruvate/2-oxoglutarate dehydrogenase complex dihydrolipoamide dehydrogenase (E3) component